MNSISAVVAGTMISYASQGDSTSGSILDLWFLDWVIGGTPLLREDMVCYVIVRIHFFLSILLEQHTMSSPPGTPPSQRSRRQPVRRSSDRIRRQQIYNCFGDHGAEELSPVQALGKLSAVAMLTTARVGNQEDPSMAQARPHLAEVNKRGLVTTDSQMGAKKQITHHFFEGHVLNPPVTHWQRSYILGILPKGFGDKFKEKMGLVDGVDFFIGRHGHDPPHASTHYINVTMEHQNSDPEFDAAVPMATSTLGYSLSGLLPEVKDVVQSDTCVNIVKEDALLVNIVDLVWGRPFWLFEKVKEVLDEVIAENNSHVL